MAGRVRKTRLSTKKGFTLAETLLAILILLMVTAVVAAGIPVAAHAYERVVMSSNAQLLLSTTMTRMRDELGTATEISVATENNVPVIRYTADNGRKCIIKYEDNTAVAGNAAKTVGIHLTENFNPESESGYKHLLVTQQAATKSLYATFTSAVYSKGIVTVTGLRVIEISTGKVITEAQTFEISILTDRT